MPPAGPAADPLPSRLLLLAGLAVAGAVLIRTAWVCDDAYITLRLVDNFVHGYGLRWNIDERVAVFTHPLWMMLVAAAYGVTREAYFTVLTLGISLTLVAIGVAVAFEDTAVASLTLLTLVSSKAFVDFSTSGLENPLTNLLLALFVIAFGSRSRRPIGLALIAGLAWLNRLDLWPLLAPALAVATLQDARQRGGRRALSTLGAGLSPVIVWTLFSLVYFGSPFPNTAYAKLSSGIPEAALFRQGLYYFGLGARFDPVTLLVIGAAIAAMASEAARRYWPLLLGVAGECLYIALVGGDFMFGRFLVAPFFVSLLIARRAVSGWSRAAVAATGAAILIVGLTAPYQPPLLSGLRFGAHDPPNKHLDVHGIHDERRWYFPQTGLLRQESGTLHPNHPWADDGARMRDKPATVVVRGNIGFYGYFAGPRIHIIDPYGLADPLLARLPAEPDWRIGHFLRAVPAGYRETVAGGAPRIADPSLAEYYRRLRLITAGPLFSGARLRAIAELNLGRLRHLVKEYAAGEER